MSNANPFAAVLLTSDADPLDGYDIAEFLYLRIAGDDCGVLLHGKTNGERNQYKRSGMWI